jgi:DNA-directed RNA polymerase subunit F
MSSTFGGTMPENQQPELFESVRSRFSENYLRREHKTLLTKADIALTELVANAWDAGASLVEITIPSKRDGVLSIEDDGTGMAADEFLKIWPELRYDRLKARGRTVTFPPNVNRTPRVAYGSNGIGRHAMLCFCSTYEVDTTKAGERARFEVTESSGESAIDVRLVTKKLWTGHGTKMSCKVKFILPDPVEMLEVLSARFAHDPEFVIRVNGQAASLEDHSALVKHTPFTYGDGIEAQLFVLDTQRTARTVGQHGVTFWVGKRRVGTPSWDRVRLDGRLKEARRITFIVRTDAEEIRPDVREDWTGFRETKLVNSLYEATEAAVLLVLTEIFQKKTTERTEEVIEGRREAIRNLDPLAQVEVAQLAREVATEQPLVSTEILTAAVDALIRIENSRSGQALIQKLAKLTPEDVDGLNLILEEWTIKDALTVLGEVGRRLRVVEAISRLSEDKLVDELHTLHPLVAQARWLFGIEFDTPAYISNISLSVGMVAALDIRGRWSHPVRDLVREGYEELYQHLSDDGRR